MSSSIGVLWITGLSGAGKSTLAGEVAALLRNRGDCVVLLDGDEMREVLGSNQSSSEDFGREGRIALARRYSALARLLSAQGLTVIVATISLFREVHEWNRRHIPNYFEVYLKVPVTELQRRDPKGIYARYGNGELRNVAGLDLLIDEPERPDLVVEFKPGQAVSDLANNLLERTGR